MRHPVSVHHELNAVNSILTFAVIYARQADLVNITPENAARFRGKIDKAVEALQIIASQLPPEQESQHVQSRAA